MGKKIFFIIIIFFFILVIYLEPGQAFGVRPLSFDLEMRPGEQTEFQLTLLPSERQQVVNINLFEPRQNLNGSLSYIPAEDSDYEVLEWIDITNQITVPPNEEVVVEGSISVPFGSEGSYSATLMVQEELQSREGVQVRYRYAVRLSINVPQPWIRERMSLVEFDLIADGRGRPELIAHIENPSRLSYGAHGEVTVRDENRRLVERVPLRTSVGSVGTIIYPEAEVQFREVISAPLFPGDYDLRLFMRYADGRQIIQSKQVTLGDEFLTEEALRYLEVNPERISSEIRPGGANSSMIELRNLVGEEIYFGLDTVEVIPGYERSIFSELEFDLRGSGRNMLISRGNDRLMALVRAPREGEAGGYYGSLEVEVYSSEGELLETKLIDIEAVVEGELIETLELRDLTALVDEEETLLSLSVRNSGNIAFAPRGTAYIYSDEGEILRTVPLRLMEDVERILPQFSGFMTGTVEDLDPGEYFVQVRTELAGDILTEEKFVVKFSKENGGN